MRDKTPEFAVEVGRCLQPIVDGLALKRRSLIVGLSGQDAACGDVVWGNGKDLSFMVTRSAVETWDWLVAFADVDSHGPEFVTASTLLSVLGVPDPIIKPGDSCRSVEDVAAFMGRQAKRIVRERRDLGRSFIGYVFQAQELNTRLRSGGHAGR